MRTLPVTRWGASRPEHAQTPSGLSFQTQHKLHVLGVFYGRLPLQWLVEKLTNCWGRIEDLHIERRVTDAHGPHHDCQSPLDGRDFRGQHDRAEAPVIFE